jgi:heterodisulfide reductase subunit C
MDILPNRMVWELQNGRTEELLTAESPWLRCPRGVSPAAVMEAVRLLRIRQQGANRLQAEELERYPDALPQQALVAAFRKYNK